MKKLLSVLAVSACVHYAHAQDYQFSNGVNRLIEPEEQADLHENERFNLHMQATYILQYKPAFNAPYEGIHSLKGSEEDENSLSATLFAGARLWKGGEIYINPEVAGGSGLSAAEGMAGQSNGETFRIDDSHLSLYMARAYFRQTFSLTKNGTMGDKMMASGQNQLAGYTPVDYLRFYIGKLSLPDLFDVNTYSGSPRTQFMNWAFMNNGAWDYAADTRGYTYSFVAELQKGSMNYKLGGALMPESTDGPDLNTNIGESAGLQAEIGRAYKWNGKKGNIKLLGYYNRGRMGSYQRAIAKAITDNDTPDANLVGKEGDSKYGFGISFEQELDDNWGVFARLGWNDGLNQSLCNTEIDYTATAGISGEGRAWKRPNDNAGLAIIGNGISQDHRQYLAFGGTGLILGDGALNYAPELIAELYYSFRPLKKAIWFTGDYQFCLNPGYNADRGPVNIFSLRVHAEL